MDSSASSSRWRVLALGACAGASLGVLELAVRTWLAGSMPWEPADPVRELWLAAAWTALFYALPGLLLAALLARFLRRSPPLRRALALAPLLALLACAGLAISWDAPEPRRAVARAPENAPSVLLVTLDTVRIDALGAYGNASARTPTIDALAAQGIRFGDATVQSILTGPSHVSILSGLSPPLHGVTENLHALEAHVPTLADTLGYAGWQTGAFVSGYPLKQRSLKLIGQFETRDDDFRAWRCLPYLSFETCLGKQVAYLLKRFVEPLDPTRRPAERVTDHAIDWLGARDPRPFFAWVHYFDAHLPYSPPDRFLSQAERDYAGPADGRWYQVSEATRAKITNSPESVRHMRALYDAELAYIDEQLARLVRAARERAGKAGVYIVVTSDHGESFGEHDIWYARDLYEDCLRVPLIIAAPEPLSPGRVVEDPVRSIDVAPTLFEALGVAPAQGLEGRSLMEWFGEQARPAELTSVAAIYPTRGGTRSAVRLAFRQGGWKAIWDFSLEHPSTSPTELYHLPDDPGELRNRAPQDPARFESLRERLDPRVLEPGIPKRPLTESELDVLRSLGYAR